MAKRKSQLDDLKEYQNHQYSPHTYHIQKGELPYHTRQLMKAPGRAAVFCLILALLCLLTFLAELLQFLQNQSNPLPVVYAVIALAFTVVCIIGAIQNFRKVKALKRKATPQEKDKKK